MPKIIEAHQARTKLGNLLNEVRYAKQSFIIRRAKQPMAAIIPIEIYQALLEVPENEIELYSDKRINEFLAADRKK